MGCDLQESSNRGSPATMTGKKNFRLNPISLVVGREYAKRNQEDPLNLRHLGIALGLGRGGT